jgi:ATP-grasp ribosomal peptide maturase
VSVVVITRRQDPTADLVILRLAARGVPVARFDLGEFPQVLAVAGRLAPGTRRWTGRITAEHRTIKLADVAAVWYRKPTRFAFHPAMSATERAWAEREAKAGLGGLLAALPVKWVNHPYLISAAERKPVTLSLAAACGLTVPDTLLTSDARAAQAFCAEHPHGVVYKSLRGGPRSENGQVVALYTTPVTAAEITGDVAHTMHLFQERIHPKAFEVRLTVVGETMFGLRIDARTEAGRVDWRADHDQLDYRVTEVPADVRQGVTALLKQLGLAYAALDLIVDDQGRWVFAGDVNPNGQWAWDHPLRDAIADALADELGGTTR